jgi:hypothetical protein
MSTSEHPLRLNSITVAWKPMAAAPTVSSGDSNWAWAG